MRSSTLIETAPGSGRFAWSARGNGRWIGAFKRIQAPGRCEVEVWDGRGAPKAAVVKATASGFALTR